MTSPRVLPLVSARTRPGSVLRLFVREHETLKRSNAGASYVTWFDDHIVGYGMCMGEHAHAERADTGATRQAEGGDTSTDGVLDVDSQDGRSSGRGVHMSYARFGAMIATSTIVMFGLMYLNTYSWDHVRWSETRAYMALVMGATMAFIMLGFMLSMYKNTMVNVGIIAAAVLVFAGSLWLVRSQTTVQDRSYMRAMIPHHSIAILTSERSELSDFRVCELAVGIIEAQQREIAEMDWLIDDIGENGVAANAAEAGERPVPEFAGTSIRTCG